MVLQGKIKDGLGNASFWVKKIEDIFFFKYGLKLFYGTLNVELKEEYELQNYWTIYPEEYGGTQNVFVQKCKLLGHIAYIVRAKNSAHKCNILEIIKEKIIIEKQNELEEIRLRANKKIILKYNSKEEILNYIISSQDILNTLQLICENSIYTFQKEICEGYITVKGGHRVGITGNCVIENGKVININYISSLNFRIARQVIGCSNNIIEKIINRENKTVNNTLIVSLPGAGKTTLLRELQNVRNKVITKILHNEDETKGRFIKADRKKE